MKAIEAIGTILGIVVSVLTYSDLVLTILVWLMVLAIYFLPTIVGIVRDSMAIGWLASMNLLAPVCALYGTVILSPHDPTWGLAVIAAAWFAILVWAVIGD